MICQCHEIFCSASARKRYTLLLYLHNSVFAPVHSLTIYYAYLKITLTLMRWHSTVNSTISCRQHRHSLKQFQSFDLFAGTLSRRTQFFDGRKAWEQIKSVGENSWTQRRQFVAYFSAKFMRNNEDWRLLFFWSFLLTN